MTKSPLPDTEPVAIAEVVSAYGDPEAFGEREIRVLADLSKIPYRTKLYSQAALTAANTRADAAQAEVERLRDILDKDPKAIVIAFRDGDHERLSRAAGAETKRAELAETTLASAREALEKLRSYNVDIEAGRINYRPLDHIAVIDAALSPQEPGGQK